VVANCDGSNATEKDATEVESPVPPGLHIIFILRLITLYASNTNARAAGGVNVGEIT
jgi:hypothetical protein